MESTEKWQTPSAECARRSASPDAAAYQQAIENIEADKVVELFPGLLETLQEPAMLLYDVTWRRVRLRKAQAQRHQTTC